MVSNFRTIMSHKSIYSLYFWSFKTIHSILLFFVLSFISNYWFFPLLLIHSSFTRCHYLSIGFYKTTGFLDFLHFQLPCSTYSVRFWALTAATLIFLWQRTFFLFLLKKRILLEFKNNRLHSTFFFVRS